MFFGKNEGVWVAEVWIVTYQHLVLEEIALLTSFDTKDVTESKQTCLTLSPQDR